MKAKNTEVMMEKVSIIMPTYGSHGCLDKSIQSVMNQTYTDWELIIVDDNNPDTEARKETEQLVKMYQEDERIRYIQHNHNRNGSAARNTGISCAVGSYIAFLDSDDEYMPRRLIRCVESLSECTDPTFAGVYTGCEITQNGKIIRRRTNIKSGNFITEALAAGFPLSSGSNLFIRSDVVRELDGFDTSFRRHQDYEFLVRFFRKYSLIAIPDILLVKNEIGINRQNTEMFYKTKRNYLEKYEKDIKKLSNKDQKYIYVEHYLSLQSTAFNQHKVGQFCKFTFCAFKKRSTYTVIRTAKLFVRTILGKHGKVNL